MSASLFHQGLRAAGRLGLIVAILLHLPALAAAQETVKVFCWSLTPQSQAVIRGVERVLQRSLPVASADGEAAKAVQLSRQFSQEKLQVLVVLGSQALIHAAQRIKKTPVVFAMVADPFQTGAAYDRNRPQDHQENIIGLASPPPLAEALHQTLALFPTRRHWGLVFNPAEGASVELQQEFANLAKQNGLSLTIQAATAPAGADSAIQQMLAQGVEVFFLPPDQFSETYAPPLLALGQQQRLIVVNGNPRLPAQGAVLSVTLAYEAVGEEAGRLVQRLLAGEKPKGIPLSLFSPAQVAVDEALLSRWAGYPPKR